MAAPSTLTIDLAAIRHNVGVFSRATHGHAAVMAVVKANGYGHGALPVARAALRAGAAWLGVAQLGEAIALREAGIQAPILVMGFTPPEHARDAVACGARVTLYESAHAASFSQAALDAGRSLAVHLKVDTGMGRLGALPDDVPALVARIGGLPGLQVEGIFTHFSCADCDPEHTREQIARFRRVLARVPRMAVVHACNSAGALAYPEAHFDMIRPGIGLYGLDPFAPAPAPADSARALRPALRWTAQVASVKVLPHGWAVSYGATFRCEGERRIAVIPVGYGDGLRRAPNNPGEVLIRGQRAPIVGRVCMDQTMIDVTDVPGADYGDTVTLLGADGAQSITAGDIAAKLGTIHYDVVTSLLARPQRDYING